MTAPPPIEESLARIADNLEGKAGLPYDVIKFLESIHVRAVDNATNRRMAGELLEKYR